MMLFMIASQPSFSHTLGSLVVLQPTPVPRSVSLR
jgi:hypothetical protein